MGLQERYFGRWLLPALPGARDPRRARRGARLLDLRRRERRRAARSRWRAAGVAVALAAQGLYYSVHVDRVLSRDDTRNIARAWMVAHIPAALEGRGRADRARRVVRRRRRAHRRQEAARRGLTDSGRRWIKFPTGRTTLDEQGRVRRGGKGRFVSIEDYERTLRPSLLRLLRSAAATAG